MKELENMYLEEGYISGRVKIDMEKSLSNTLKKVYKKQYDYHLIFLLEVDKFLLVIYQNLQGF